MVKHNEAALDAVFAALANRTRRRILSRLAKGDASVGELASPQRMSWPAVTKHLHVLERARLVSRKKDGRVHRMTFEGAPLGSAREWIERHRKFREGAFGALAKVLEDTAGAGEVRHEKGGRNYGREGGAGG